MADKNPHAPRGHSVGTGWPSWRYAQDGSGDSAVFKSEAEVPEGWLDTPPQPKAPSYQRPPARGAAPKIELKKQQPKDPWPKPVSE